jgi:hypothetical protein
MSSENQADLRLVVDILASESRVGARTRRRGMR